MADIIMESPPPSNDAIAALDDWINNNSDRDGSLRNLAADRQLAPQSLEQAPRKIVSLGCDSLYVVLPGFVADLVDQMDKIQLGQLFNHVRVRYAVNSSNGLGQDRHPYNPLNRFPTGKSFALDKGVLVVNSKKAQPPDTMPPKGELRSLKVEQSTR
ncbi:hypothetical protein NEUTE1DRAFT_139382 [Neurospora tetrasperma FGSC 2508]|uniref:Uncharacterized protein n=1 Tax=Neurospora tetrasperma (strain FGSC 2508 / ATCC MYA-4615 / P0657) TaxID=510951 RepID=F8MSM5_NEUT8|nr:uncharacterized protein NEUTE1DRAFT_139382 [Neurospora tetrasperma FGSC 2508]EGO55112.1 hypothetical protein NEUTE1DRAFT_139382 [Neurospora tetrasperma FGSC 2508]